jgi:S-adenosylmethionine/arginine decarboxylase-like enzyme
MGIHGRANDTPGQRKDLFSVDTLKKMEDVIQFLRAKISVSEGGRGCGCTPSVHGGRRAEIMRGAPLPKQEHAPWGLLTSLDIYRCNPEIIRDAQQIRKYVVELCDRIEMKRFGECLVTHFGEDERVAGYSMVQLIETSLISGHFANLSNAAYIDIFSCKPYDPQEVARFSQEFFQGEAMELHVTKRM